MEDRKRPGEPLSHEPRKRGRFDAGPSAAGVPTIPTALPTPTPTTPGPHAALLEAAQRAAILKAQQVAAAEAAARLAAAGALAATGGRVGPPPAATSAAAAATAAAAAVAAAAALSAGPTAASRYGVAGAGAAEGGKKTTMLPPPLRVDASGKTVVDDAAMAPGLGMGALTSILAIPMPQKGGGMGRGGGEGVVPRPTGPAAGRGGSTSVFADVRSSHVESLAADLERAKSNPYLSHKVAELTAALARATAQEGRGKTGESAATAGEAKEGEGVGVEVGGEESDAGVAQSASTRPEYFDRRLKADGGKRRADRARRGLRFVEEGKYAIMAEQVRQEAAAAAVAVTLRESGSRARPITHTELEEGGASTDGGMRSGAPTADAIAAAATAEGWSEEDVAAARALPPKMRLVPIAPAAPMFTTLPAASAAREAALSSSTGGGGAGGGRGAPFAWENLPATSLLLDMEWWDSAFLPPDRAREYAVEQAVIAAAAKPDRTRSVFDPDSEIAQLVASRASTGGEPPTFSYSECHLSHQRTWTLVQHPVPMVSGADAALIATPITIPLMLTTKEAKRLRRQQRMEKQKEIMDKQRLGLLPPPEPKVRLANLMRVLKDAAVADPSAVEAKVRAQMEARAKNHAMRNLATKLTPEERRSRRRHKMTSHSPAGPEAALLRIPLLINRKIRFRVDVNARDFFLTGTVVEARSGGFGLLYVEGGLRAVRKYLHMLQARIDWRRAHVDLDAARRGGEDGGSDEGEDEEEGDGDDGVGPSGVGTEAAAARAKLRGYGAGPGSLCELVWRGTASKAHFTEFRFEETRSVHAARKAMDSKGLVHLWDMVAHSAHAAKVVAPTAGAVGHEAGGTPRLDEDDPLARIRAAFEAGGFLQHGPGGADGVDDSDDSDDSMVT